MGSFKDLLAYKKAYQNAMDIFEISKSFPIEERYSLTDQIRRSSRSVCANIGEAYRKRRYPAHFISKLTDADAENSETSIWIDFSRDCRYINETDHQRMLSSIMEVGNLLGKMMQDPGKFL